jgi:hypothetical protein
LLFAQSGLNCDPPIYTSHCSWGDRCMSLCPTSFGWDGVSLTLLPCLVWSCDPCAVSLLHSWDDKCANPCPAIGWDGVLWTPYLDWPWTPSLLTTAFQVARIIGVSHKCPAKFLFLKP